MSTWEMLLSLAAGVLLGVLYFGGLWLTLRHVQGSERPGLLLFTSFAVRAALLLAAFLALVRYGPWALIMALAGFLASRWLSTRLLAPKREGAG